MAQAAPDLTTIYEEHLLDLEGIIGAVYRLVASGFHALANGLSQGVPAIGTEWSYKCQMLFEAYGCPDYLLSTQDIDVLPF